MYEDIGYSDPRCPECGGEFSRQHNFSIRIAKCPGASEKFGLKDGAVECSLKFLGSPESNFPSPASLMDSAVLYESKIRPDPTAPGCGKRPKQVKRYGTNNVNKYGPVFKVWFDYGVKDNYKKCFLTGSIFRANLRSSGGSGFHIKL